MRIRFGRTLITVLLIIASAYSFALQTKMVLENQRVNIEVGINELNRILVENDRITQAFGVAGKFTIETEEETGQIFITPNQLGTMYLHLLTEKGHTIDLALNSCQISPQTVLLRLKDLKKTTSNLYYNANQSQVVELITAMASGKSYKGFTTSYESINIKTERDIKIQLIAKYIGENLIGEIYTLTNQSKEPITVQEKDFLLEPGILAIALENQELVPKTSVKLFMVKPEVN